MKNIILSAIFFIIVNSNSSFSKGNANHKIQDRESYAENVHMYVCLEALKLLKDRFPETDLSQIENRIGTMNDVGTRAWQVGKITTGTYREDIEDPVFDIRGPFGFYASNGHFWKADNRTNGDHSLTTLNILGFDTDFPNAYTKICRYIDGQWFAWRNGGYHERRYIEYNPGNGFFYRFSYHTRGFINFYKTKRIWYHSYINTLGQEVIVDEEITLGDVAFNHIVWEVFGRMIHLATDMSVPAHSRYDVHVREWDGGDCYHNYADDGAYLNYSWQTAKNAGGLINPYEIGDDPIRYIMYSANQIANHFPSGPDCFEIPQQHTGNHFLPGGSYPIILQTYQQLGPPPPNITNLSQVGNHCFNYAIRATAGLFYWFAVETGMIATDPGAYPVINSFSNTFPDNTIYRGETLKLTCNASGSNLNYNWFYKVCNTNNWCTAPISGLSFSQINNTYSIRNTNFNNRWTCSFYDSLCTISSGDSFYESPLRIFVGVTVSNQFAQITKYYNMNQPVSIHPYNGIRPPVPPITGCPVLFTGTDNGFTSENNVLNESTHSNNLHKDIEDKIVIVNEPFIDTTDNTISFAINESAGDHDFFDKISLVEVIHPEGFLVAVTENNDIVLISNNEIRSPDFAEKNGVDVTQVLAYDTLYNDKVKGEEEDLIKMEFKTDSRQSPKEELSNKLIEANYSLSYINNLNDSAALILDPSEPDNQQIINHKRPAGYISVTDTAGIKITADIEFARRQRRSLISLPVSSGIEILRASLVFKDGFDLSFCAAATLFYGGFGETELNLVEAKHSSGDNVFKRVFRDDNNYAQIDSSSFIVMKFRLNEKELPARWVRKYVMVIKGRTEAPDPDNGELVKKEMNELFISKDNPGEFELSQNYPNPFNPVTLIKYSVPADLNDKLSNVRLSVYDNLGKEVAVLINEFQTYGYHEVKFDGTNLPSGIYYYKLTAGNHVMVRKMMLVK